MTKRVLLDTGVIISYCGRHEDSFRETKAQKLIEYLKANSFDIFYSQRTQNELKVKPSEVREKFLSECKLAAYYIGNETCDKIEGTWENIGSLWDNESDGEFGLSERINIWLKKERDLQDRGILLDAIKNGCVYFIHENPKDYSKIPTDLFDDFDLKCVNLLNIDIKDFDSIFNT